MFGRWRFSVHFARATVDGDVGALDRAVRLLARSGAENAAATVAEWALETVVGSGHGRPLEQVRNLGMAWRERAIHITQDPEDLDRSVTAFDQVLEIDGTDSITREELAFTLWARHQARGEETDAARALSLADTLVGERPDLASVRGLLAEMLVEGPGGPADIDRAERLLGEAVDLFDEGAEGRAPYLTMFAGLRFDHHDDLPAAEGAIRQAPAVTVAGDPDAPERHSLLAKILERRFDADGDIARLDEAIDAWQKAADLGGRHHYNRPHYCTGLALAMRKRHERLGGFDDVDRAVRAMRDAVAAADPASAHYADRLSVLGTALQDRYGHPEGRMADLDEAITLHESALAAAADDPGFLANLGNALRLRHAAMGEMTDLDRSIALQERALELDPDNARLRNHFGTTLRARYQLTGAEEDLHRALDLHERALCDAPAGHVDHYRYLANLAEDLRLLDDCDLDLLVATHERLTAATADTDPRHAEDRLLLAEVLLRRYEAAGADRDLVRAADLAEGSTGADADRLARRIRLHRARVRSGQAVGLDDDRLATAIAGELDGRTRYLVMIYPRAEPFLMVAIGEDPTARFFVDSWDRAAIDSTVLIVQRGESGDLMMPYALPSSADTRSQEGWQDLDLLARDVLEFTRQSPQIRGPYRVPWTSLRALVLTGHFAGTVRRVGVVTDRPGHWLAMGGDELREWFVVAMTASAEPPEACWLNDSPLPSPPGSAGLSAAPTCAEYGRALLTWFTTYERDGFTYRWVGRDDRLGHDVRVRRDEDEPWSVVTMRDWPPAHHDIVVGGWESTREWSAGNYANDVHAAIDGGRLLDAFHAFTLHYRLVRPGTAADAGATFACGLTLTSALVDQGYFDLCEWVAARCAELAGRFALGGLARMFLREAAIASENRGLLAAAIHHYEEAIATPAGEPVAEISDLGHEPDVLHRQLHLDFVTTCLSLLADHEPEEFHREPLDQQLIELLHMCQTRLATAERLLRTEAAATSDWARAAARVYGWRVSDLLGDSAQAAEELGRLLAGAELAGHDHLMTTARVFHLAALRKLSENDPAWGHQYDAALRAARTDEEAWPLACVLWSLSADRLIALGDPAGAFRHAWMALRTHLLQDTRQVQPPRPGETHAGWLAIDVLARLLECHARQAEEHEENLPSILTVLAVESAKGRWFRRDLSRGLRQLPDGGIEYRPTVRGPDDLDERLHRVRTLAEEEWASGRRKPRRQRPRRRKRASQEFFEAFREPSTAELRRNLPEGSALLSFYAARKRSYVYCLTPDRSLLLRLHTTLPDLNRAVLALQAAFSGTGLYGRIDPSRPHEVDDRLMRPMRELIWQLSPLTAIVRDTPLILISPHRAWHNIPIHALLLPQIWETGRNVALAYVPSLGVAEDLFKRTKNRAASRRAGAAVASTPRVAAEQHAFHDWHRRIADLLGDACPRVTSVHGAEATADEVVSMASHAELLHILAHGWYRGDAEIGDSGLVMADGTLTGDALLDGEVTAEHLTLHACSMGRVVTSATDDLWGFARGALLSGIDSVLAPMWDIDLDSSGHLLERFYTHWLAEGRSKVLAFTEAQRELYDGAGQQAWRHQYHWAAFKLLGV